MKEEENYDMSLLGDLICWIFGGLVLAIIWFVIGILLMVTIIGIPFGLQCFKIAGFVLFPFGREIDLGGFGVGGFIFNLIWIIVVGWELAMAHLIAALFCAITIIGIPFALQHIKLAQLAFMPFGARIR